MNKLITLAFSIICCCLTGLTAQKATPLTTEAPPATTHQVVLTFDSPLTKEERGALAQRFPGQEVLDITVTASGKYARVTLKGTGSEKNLPSCDDAGNGNTGIPATASGDGGYFQIGNDLFSRLYVLPSLTLNCSSASWQDSPSTALEMDRFYGFDYNLFGRCSDEDDHLRPPTGPKAVKVAIIDSGVSYDGDLNHKDASTHFNGVRLKQIEPPSYVHGQHIHGNYIASIITSMFRSEGLTDQLDLVSYKVLDKSLRGSLFDIIAAIEHAALVERVDIINLSLSFPGLVCSTPNGDFYFSILTGALETAAQEGVVVINSAGNDGHDLSTYPVFPAANTVTNGLVTVGAINCYDETLASWSNRNPDFIELVTVGNDITPTLEQECRVSGTSFAAPIVTAVAALHATTLPVFNQAAIMEFLKSSVVDHTAASWGQLYLGQKRQSEGPGLPEKFEKSGGSPSLRSVSVAPNPFTNELRLTLPDSAADEAYQVAVYDLSGKRLYQAVAKPGTLGIDVSTFVAGTYWVSVKTDAGARTFPVIRR